MCFTNDHDWYAEVYEATESVAVKPTRCDECFRDVPAGGGLIEIHLQQHEYCQCCTESECECPKDKDGDCIDGCQCEEPDFGESFDYKRCLDCNRFLNAVQMAEEDAGCDYDEARPPLELMIEYIQNGGRQEVKKYFRTAAHHYPDLESSGYLDWLWNRMFGS